MKILVLGTNGFIGKTVAGLLAKDHEVIKATRHGEDGSTAVDLTDKNSIISCLKKYSPEAIVNCAGIVENSERARLNIVMTLNLLSALVESDIVLKRVVILGSAGEYGFINETDLPVKEEQPIAPISDYGNAKAEEVAQALDFAEKHRLPLVVARIFNPIGHGMNQRQLLPQLFKQAKEIKNKSRDTIEISRLDSRRDYIAVTDLAAAIECIIEGTPSYTIYNVGSGLATSNQQLVQTVLKSEGIDGNVPLMETQPAPERLVAVQADITRLKQDFNWQPKESIEDIIMGIHTNEK